MTELTDISDELVSIIIPIYNSEKFLKYSLDSVINQTYKNIEVICIDDGSTDPSKEILRQYSDKIQVISQKNQGLASALNNGLSKASGKWIKWFSPDDVMFPNAIETLVNQIKKFPDNTIVYSNWEIIDEKGKKIRDFSESDYNNLSEFDYNIRLIDGQQINVNTTLIPSSLFQKGCIFRNLDDPVSIDYDFFLRAAILYKMKFFLIQKSLIQYRIHNKQLSHNNILSTLNFLEQIKNEILSKLSNDEKFLYINSLKNYKKTHSLLKIAMLYGLKLLKILPSNISERILVFYLNSIRSKR